MHVKQILSLGLLLCSGSLWAQNSLDNVDWVEEKVPPPPAYSTEHLLLLDMPSYVSVRVGIDPQALSVGSDGVVRYVVVMRNASGSMNVAYEGIRCAADEVKTYARLAASGAWVMVEQPQWKAVSDNLPSRHAWALARQGACDTRIAASKDTIIQALEQRQKQNRFDRNR